MGSTIRVERLENRLLFAAGEPDPTFGGDDGVADSGFAGYATRMALAPDGSIVVAGTPSGPTDFYAYTSVVRYRPDGTLDTAFGPGGDDGDGVVSTTAGFGGADFVAVAPDGKIVVAADGASIIRFTADGQLDTGFGDGGVVSPPSGHGQSMLGLRLQPDGKILVGVSEAGPFTPAMDIIFRFNDDGTLDDTYGNSGSVFGSRLPPEPDSGLSTIAPYNIWVPDAFAPTEIKVAHAKGTPSAAVTTPDGKVIAVAGAYTLDESRGSHMAVLRFRPDGTLDPTFANAVRLGTGSGAQVLIQPGTGRILAASGSGFQVAAVQQGPPLAEPLAVPDAPPEAARTDGSTQPFEGNVTEVTFTIRYEDDRAIDISTIDGNDVRVLLPGAYFYERPSVTAELVGIDATANAAVVNATYRVVNPKGRTLPLESGQYDLKMEPGQVLDDAGNAVAGGYLHGIPFFDVHSTAPSTNTPPTATVVSATDVTAEGTAAVRIVVHYEDDLGVIGSKVDGNDVRVTAPDGTSALATPVGGPFTGAHARLDVTYEYAPAGGFTPAMNGTYRVSVEPNQIGDTSGVAVPPSPSAGSFTVDIPFDGPDLAAASLTPRDVRPGAAGRLRGRGIVTLANVGTRRAAGVAVVTVVASLDEALDTADVQVAARRVRLSLRAGQRTAVPLRLGRKHAVLPAGDYFLLARVEPAGALEEIIRSNNVTPPVGPFHVAAPAASGGRKHSILERLTLDAPPPAR